MGINSTSKPRFACVLYLVNKKAVEFLAFALLFLPKLFPSQRVGAGVQAQVSVEEEDRQHDHQRAGDELGGEGEAVEHV